APARPAAPAPAERIDPLHADEVAAFQQALAAGLRGEQALAAVGANKLPEGPTGQSYTLLTGFEDTEMAEGAADVTEHLSGTQFGALR
ncbi:MAG: hypothetical protein JWP41_412, partial [Ramlibacter sp.]|nr:hypothetical protein [Ramlibacter sp.]